MQFNSVLIFGFLSVATLLQGCGTASSDAPTMNQQAAPPKLKNLNSPIPNNSDVAQYKILVMGNSHVSGITGILDTLFASSNSPTQVENLTLSQGGFLTDRLEDSQSVDTLQETDWSHVILQAQKVSQSGQVVYPTEGTQTWIQLAKERGATPILFPEHPTRGNQQEGQRIHDIHLGIAALQSTCIAPVGLVWDRVISLRPELILHQEDGNHASELGRILTALVFYEVIANSAADLLPFIESINIDRQTQDFFGQIVSQVLAENPPCEY